MKLREVAASAENSCTEHMGLRVDRATKAKIKVYRDRYGAKAVNTWLRSIIKKAAAQEDKDS